MKKHNLGKNSNKPLSRALSLTAGSVILLSGLLLPATSAADIAVTDNFKFQGDFRFRLEEDWDSQNSSGVERDRRTRARVRARFGFQYTPDENHVFGMRLRTGSDNSHQSPHITMLDFDDNDTGDAHINFDKWYWKFKWRGFWDWAGRNSLPFWKQTEMFWDDDVTPAGLAAGFKQDLGNDHKLAVNAGYFSLPIGMQAFGGNLGLGQLVYSGKFGPMGLTLAGGLLKFDANSSDPDVTAAPATGLLLNGNGDRDYEIWIGSIQAKFKAGDVPIVIGGEIMRNEEDYDITEPNRDETDGHVGFIKVGNLKQKNGWLVAYYNARIEALAVNSSYAQDDWVRWGSAVESRGSNLKGHEIRLGYGFEKNFHALLRVYIAEAITTIEDGKRARLDFNYKY